MHLLFTGFAVKEQIALAYNVLVFGKDFRLSSRFSASWTIDISLHAAKIIGIN